MTGEEFIKYASENKVKSITDNHNGNTGYYCAYFNFEITFENGDIIRVSTYTDCDQGIMEYELVKSK